MGLLTNPFMERGERVGALGCVSDHADGDDEPRDYALLGGGDAFAILTKAPPADSSPRWSVWGAGFGGSQSTDGNAGVGSNRRTSSIYGTAVGADYLFLLHTLPASHSLAAARA